jgi:hypothetical protein
VILRPFFRYYGGKWRAVHAGLYPQPLHKQIMEPFAGAAGYALHYSHLQVDLVERNPIIAGIWQWLIDATPDEVRSIPLVDSTADLPGWVPLSARHLVGFSMNAATSSPRVSLSASARKLREQGRKFYGWTHEMRERVATQVPYIKHWTITQGNYTDIEPDHAGVTWFIDPPYEDAGRHYEYGSDGIDYDELATWCRSRLGQPIVCESPGAKWLPFRDIGAVKSGPRSGSSREAVWP